MTYLAPCEFVTGSDQYEQHMSPRVQAASASV